MKLILANFLIFFCCQLVGQNIIDFEITYEENHSYKVDNPVKEVVEKRLETVIFSLVDSNIINGKHSIEIEVEDNVYRDAFGFGIGKVVSEGSLSYECSMDYLSDNVFSFLKIIEKIKKESKDYQKDSYVYSQNWGEDGVLESAVRNRKNIYLDSIISFSEFNYSDYGEFKKDLDFELLKMQKEESYLEFIEELKKNYNSPYTKMEDIYHKDDLNKYIQFEIIEEGTGGGLSSAPIMKIKWKSRNAEYWNCIRKRGSYYPKWEYQTKYLDWLAPNLGEEYGIISREFDNSLYRILPEFFIVKDEIRRYNFHFYSKENFVKMVAASLKSKMIVSFIEK